MNKHTLPTLFKKTTGGGTQEWRTWVESADNGNGIICVEYGLQGGKKQILREEIKAGKNQGRSNSTTPYEQAVAEAESRWNKQKDRKGYGLTVDESAAVRSASAMLAQSFEKKAGKVDWSTAFAQPKLDGFRLLARCTAPGKIELLSRENQPMPALVAIGRELAKFMDPGTTLDGEAYCHGMPLNKISSACKKKGPLTDQIRYHVYDCMDDGSAFSARYDYVKGVASGCELLVAVPTVKIRSEVELMRCQSTFIDDGYEGAMLRHGRVGYEAGKRSAHLLKVKTFVDGEFEVIDFKMGRGKYENMPIFTCRTIEGHVFDVLAPGNLEEKRALGAKAQQLIGKKLTVKYQYLTKTNEPVPFLPVAKGFR